MEHFDSVAWEQAGVRPAVDVELMLQDCVKRRGGGGEGADDLFRRRAVVEFDRVGWRGGGFEKGEVFCGGVVVEFGGDEGVAFLEPVEDSGQGGGDLLLRFGHLEYQHGDAGAGHHRAAPVLLGVSKGSGVGDLFF